MKNLIKGIAITLFVSAFISACGGGSPSTDSTETKLLAASDSSSPTTTQWTFCANENGQCVFTGTQTVRYGAGSTFVTKSLSWGASCNNSTFGDPLPGTAKHCEVTSSWGFCANENGQCAFSGTQTVRYGSGSTFVTQTLTGGAACNNSMFGDPTPGTAKHCDVAATTWTLCANENGQCGFSGTKPVLYGASGSYTVKTLTGGAACNNATFGDPAPGATKHCYIPGVSTADTGGTPAPSGFVVSEAQFNSWFPNRNSFYSYSGLITAMGAYPAFANTGGATIQRQEAAAFFANVDQETGGLQYIRELNTNNWNSYCLSGNCGGKQYYGRGAMQLSWDYNYSAAGSALGIDLLNNPDLVATDSAISWKTALWYWMTQKGQTARTPHDAMAGSVGFAETIRAINGGVECNQPAGSLGNQEMNNRVNFYTNFTGSLGVPAGSNLTC